MIFTYYIIGFFTTLILSSAQNYIYNEKRPFVVDLMIAFEWCMAVPLVILNISWDWWHKNDKLLPLLELHGRGTNLINASKVPNPSF